MINRFFIGFKDEDPLVIVESTHAPELGDIIHYLCNGTEDDYEYLKTNNLNELEGVVVSKWTSLTYKWIVWTVEVKKH